MAVHRWKIPGRADLAAPMAAGAGSSRRGQGTCNLIRESAMKADEEKRHGRAIVAPCSVPLNGHQWALKAAFGLLGERLAISAEGPNPAPAAGSGPARPAGFEPATSASGGQRSIH
jgi:hypothetical protein